MTRTSRTRTRPLGYSAAGTVVRTGNNTAPSTTVIDQKLLGTETCQDSVGSPWTDSSLEIKRGKAPSVYVNGVRKASGFTYTSTTVPLQSTPTLKFSTPWTQMGDRNLISNATLGAMAVASMNPNNPKVDLPVFLTELRELPSLLQDAGRIALGLSKRSLPSGSKAAAKANLAAQFGIAPVVSDLLTMMNFVDDVARREQQLRDMAKGFKRYKRVLTRETWDSTVQDSNPWHFEVDVSNNTNKIRMQYHATRVYWFTARSKLSASPTEREIQSLAWRSVLGLNGPSIAQVWELLPWSWLIDWFTTTGTLMRAYRGGIPWTWQGINVMSKTEYHVKGWFPNQPATWSPNLSNPQCKATIKRRSTASGWALPEFRLPYLNNRQFSILASLITLRAF